ncbi:MAG: MFS transporter [Rhodoferax sp.]|nr:MFS transporter [Rhodoferax sp.]
MSESAAPPDGPRFALARLITGQVCLHACMSGMRLASPLLALREGYSPLAVGFLLALFALMQVFLALPAGRYVDRHGLKRPMAWSVGIAFLGAGLAAAFPIFPVLCLSALMTGGATGVASLALQRHVGRAASGAAELKRVFSWLSIGPAISNFIGPFSAGVLIDYSGFRAAFSLMALLALVAWLWVRSAVELPSVVTEADAGPKKAWDLLREPLMRRLLLVNWLLSSCWDVHTFVVPVLGHERGFSASVIGAILGAFAIAATVVRVALPFVATRVNEWTVVGSAMLATAVLFVAYPFMASPLAMGMCSVLLGLVLGSVQPMIMSTLHQITPGHRHGEALGLRLMTINASSVLMPLLFGTAGAVVGVSVVFWSVGVAVGAGSRLGWLLRPPSS